MFDTEQAPVIHHIRPTLAAHQQNSSHFTLINSHIGSTQSSSLTSNLKNQVLFSITLSLGCKWHIYMCKCKEKEFWSVKRHLRSQWQVWQSYWAGTCQECERKLFLQPSSSLWCLLRSHNNMDNQFKRHMYSRTGSFHLHRHCTTQKPSSWMVWVEWSSSKAFSPLNWKLPIKLFDISIGLWDLILIQECHSMEQSYTLLLDSNLSSVCTTLPRSHSDNWELNELSSRRLRWIIAGIVNHLNAVKSLWRWRLMVVCMLWWVYMDSWAFII